MRRRQTRIPLQVFISRAFISVCSSRTLQSFALRGAQNVEKILRMQLISHFRPVVILLCTYLLIMADPTEKYPLKTVESRCGSTPNCGMLDKFMKSFFDVALTCVLCAVQKTLLPSAAFRL